MNLQRSSALPEAVPFGNQIWKYPLNFPQNLPNPCIALSPVVSLSALCFWWSMTIKKKPDNTSKNNNITKQNFTKMNSKISEFYKMYTFNFMWHLQHSDICY